MTAHRAAGVLAAAAGGSFALGLSRALAETFYSSLDWLATWPAVLLLACAAALLGWLAARREWIAEPAALLPLFLPLAYVFHPEVDLIWGWTWLLGSGLLTAMLTVRAGRWIPLALTVVTLGVYLRTLGRSVGRADTFEFQVVAYRLGIAHPTGYPLYLLLGKLFTFLPVGSVAFRVNLLSAACAAGATLLLYAALHRLAAGQTGSDNRSKAIAMLGALAFAFSPTLWSQAIEAEVYALNSLFAALALWLLSTILPSQNPPAVSPPGSFAALASPLSVPLLFLALGLSLANHLTTIILLPAVALALLLARPRLSWRRWALAGGLFLAGLSLYFYLPLRWPAVHQGELMPLSTLVDWVIGGRFKGALQLGAWWSDPTRYQIIGRLVLDQWGWPGVALAAAGLLWLARQRWQVALVTLTMWLGYAFYALSYYVPDISVFLIPAHLAMALWMGCGAAGMATLARRPLPTAATVTLFALVPLTLLGHNWHSVDRSGANPLEAWGRHVLGLELAQGATILADSEKIAPLYYLQQTERLRPDLSIMVLPDEASYRAELDARLAAGGTVYLARFLPGLEGVYHLRSVPGAAAPLVEVSNRPLTSPPPLDMQLDARFGPQVTLLGYTAGPWQTAYPGSFPITLYWTADAPVDGAYQVWLRLVDATGRVRWQSDGAYAAGNYYPTSAWRPGEIIPDHHDVPAPLARPPGRYELQVALLVPFGGTGLIPERQAGPWLTLSRLEITPPTSVLQPDRAARVWLADGDTVITGVELPAGGRPQAAVPLALHATGGAAQLAVGWDSGSAQPTVVEAPAVGLELQAPAANGTHTLIASGQRMRCGWLQPWRDQCALATLDVQGTPLPAGAVNFSDLIALLNVEMADPTLRPGGALDVTLTWQALAPISADYTVFLHLLDPADRIVGQVDSWPVQGTLPTSQWPAGETIMDRYSIPIAPDAPAGAYRLEIGWYLLSTMRRLPLLDPAGVPLDDRLLLEGLVIPN